MLGDGLQDHHHYLINYPIVLQSVDGIKESFPLCVAQGSDLPSDSHRCPCLSLVPVVAPLGFHFPLEGPDVANIGCAETDVVTYK